MKRYYIIILIFCACIIKADAIQLSAVSTPVDTFDVMEPTETITVGDSGTKRLQFFHNAAANTGNTFKFSVLEPIVITFDFSVFDYNRNFDGAPLPASDFLLQLMIKQDRKLGGESFLDTSLPFWVKAGTDEIYYGGTDGSCSFFITSGDYEIVYSGFYDNTIGPIKPLVTPATVIAPGANSSVTLHYSASAYTNTESPTNPYPSIPSPANTDPVTLPATDGHNNIVKRAYRTADGSVYDETTEYYDGLGRLEETVLTGITHDRNSLVSITEYDGYGRESIVWLPGKCSGASDNSYADPSSAKSFSVTTNNDSKPYSRKIYESSPLGRLLEQYGAGNVWHTACKRVTEDYLANSGSQPELTVRLFTYTDGSLSKQISSSGYYPDGALRAGRVADEDGNTVITFTDRQGNIVLTRSVSGSGGYLDTYYIYDGFGKLQAVLPPALSASAGNGTLDSDLVDRYAYLYLYNTRDELTGRKLPGAGWEEMAYNTDSNRLIWSQDAVQRSRNECTVFLYDVLGRECISGIAGSVPLTVSAREPVEYTGNTSGLGGYDNVDGVNMNFKQILSVNYYDNYDFTGLYDIPQSLLPADSRLHITQGQLTGTLSARLSDDASGDASVADISVVSYDGRGNVIRTVSSNPLGHYDVENLEYNFVNQVTERTIMHNADTTDDLLTETYTYTYDHAGRALKTTHSINGDTEVTLADNSYDALGRLSADKRNGNAALSTAYSYNVRSRPTEISGSLFSESLYYTDNPYRSSNGLYSGNISAMSWSAASVRRGYDFSYDSHCRLTQAKYYENGANDRYTASYTYDSMGNMLTLKRNGLQDGGTYGLVDNLTYSYVGNRLQKVSDSVEDPTYAGAFNFKDGAGESVEYTYDALGNLTSDANRGITSITYNAVRQPERITFGNGRSVSYVYGSDGTKLRTVHTTPLPPTSVTTTYSKNLIYENGTLKQVLVDGGYITFKGTSPVYHFYLQDHLGNNRIVADASGNAEQINHYYPYGGIISDISTGSDIQRYKYNGKELDRMHGLYTYDYGARQYDAARCGWDRIDPMAEKYYDVSPYAYCMDNPVNNIDPDGNSVWTKILKATAKIGAKVSKNGLKELGNVATYADAVSDITDNVSTLFDDNASTLDKIGAGVSLASEFLPVSVGDVKDAGKIVKKVKHRIRANDGFAKPHGGKIHNDAIDNHILNAKEQGALDVRKNQKQVDFNGNTVGNNRPDAQYNLNGKHYNIEFDNNSRQMKKHQLEVSGNDPDAINKFYKLTKTK